MTRVLIQLFFVLLAGVALFAMWRRVARMDRFFGLVVGLGIMGRALLGQVLFWLSWLELVPRRFHLGGGIWFFALDAQHYMATAVQAARNGPLGLLGSGQGSTAATYVELLSSFAWLFGGVASIGLLLNLFCYVGTCLVIAQCSKGTPEARPAALFFLVAFSFYPTGVLWSLQPLKDTLSHFLLVALAGSALLWQRAWRREGSLSWIVWACLGILLSLYGTTGTRWYLGLAILCSVGVFLFLVLVTTKTRRLALLGVSAGLFLVLTRVFLVTGGEMVPQALKLAILRPTAPAEPVRVSVAVSPPGGHQPAVQRPSNAGSLATEMVSFVERTRSGFARTGGTTEIQLAGNPSPVRRWIGGLIATILPHAVIEHLSFMTIGGGRGLFWFADLDTVVFDVVVFLSIFLILRRWRVASLSNAALWLVLLTAIFVAVPLLYAITNFGTLLRFRGMILVLFAMAPLVSYRGAPRLPSSDPQ
ncbi:MAG: hypothetical protein ABI779_04725 [Acidobacteriota bacterium]